MSDWTYITSFRNLALTSGAGIGSDNISAIGSTATQNVTIVSKSTGNVYLKINTVDRLTVLGNGNVGIGLGGPNYKLDVAGDINFTRAIIKDQVAFKESQWITSGF